jgi:histidine ammonia-lyase/phenylalanine ammonia-lyase
VARVARSPGNGVRFADEAVTRISDSREVKLQLVGTNRPIYGVTTGVGDSADRQIHGDGAPSLQRFVGSAVTSEALKNAGPVSVFSRSVEAHNQDKVSLSPIAARDARQIVELDLRGVDRASPR